MASGWRSGLSKVGRALRVIGLVMALVAAGLALSPGLAGAHHAEPGRDSQVLCNEANLVLSWSAVSWNLNMLMRVGTTP